MIRLRQNITSTAGGIPEVSRVSLTEAHRTECVLKEEYSWLGGNDQIQGVECMYLHIYLYICSIHACSTAAVVIIRLLITHTTSAMRMVVRPRVYARYSNPNQESVLILLVFGFIRIAVKDLQNK